MTDIYAPAPGRFTDSETLLESYRTYDAVERAIDHLSDEGFPVEYLRVVGQGVTTVEHIEGRMTTGKAALRGGAAGIWTGLLFGLLLAIFLPTPDMAGVILAAVAVGAVWGGSLGFVTHWSTGGRRDFVSRKSIEASRYDLMVDSEFADQAREKLALR
ncbi:general stress protein [Rhodococcus sp. CH91]|uniref:general stress protein n=1 Tax=Rhodococcus sp. CH91 TaxID=2910256 RepID=UPI001F4AE7DA|nr:general stress protein [Rhodococcus sp. CH91]